MIDPSSCKATSVSETSHVTSHTHSRQKVSVFNELATVLLPVALSSPQQGHASLPLPNPASQIPELFPHPCFGQHNTHSNACALFSNEQFPLSPLLVATAFIMANYELLFHLASSPGHGHQCWVVILAVVPEAEHAGQARRAKGRGHQGRGGYWWLWIL